MVLKSGTLRCLLLVTPLQLLIQAEALLRHGTLAVLRHSLRLQHTIHHKVPQPLIIRHTQLRLRSIRHKQLHVLQQQLIILRIARLPLGIQQELLQLRILLRIPHLILLRLHIILRELRLLRMLRHIVQLLLTQLHTIQQRQQLQHLPRVIAQQLRLLLHILRLLRIRQLTIRQERQPQHSLQVTQQQLRMQPVTLLLQYLILVGLQLVQPLRHIIQVSLQLPLTIQVEVQQLLTLQVVALLQHIRHHAVQQHLGLHPLLRTIKTM
jgi:hypothetical protein